MEEPATPGIAAGGRPAAEILWRFGEAEFDERTLELRVKGLRTALERKPMELLLYLLRHAGEVATKETLFEAVWPGRIVTEASLTKAVARLREVLGDTGQTLIRTVYGYGYRLVVEVRTEPADPATTRQRTIQRRSNSLLVGREAELQKFQRWFDTASSGERQVVFVTGEPGIGKTALLDAFLAQAVTTDDCWIGCGQCIDQGGAGEAYLPILQALEQLGACIGGQHLREVLLQFAPTWLAQLPALLDAATTEVLLRKAAGATQARMLRELATALEELTKTQTLVLVLEDLHWSDLATLEVLAFLARRRESARLLVLASFRPVEMLMNGHPLKSLTQELFVHQLASELALEPLGEDDIAKYIDLRFPIGALPVHLAQALHRQTDGNPLFVVSVLHDLEIRGLLGGDGGNSMLHRDLADVATHIPGTVRQFIRLQQERLSSAERLVLEAASVVGTDFSAAAAAGAGEGEEWALETVDECCGALARREHFLRAQGIDEWADGTVATRYCFIHALYREVLYEQIPPARCIRLHGRIGNRIEQGYGQLARGIAAELAIHFVQGRDYPKAVLYLRYAGENALRRSSHHEAIAHLTQGLELLATLPESRERARQELALQAALGPAWMMTKGFATSEMEDTYSQALTLCRQVGEPPELTRILLGLWNLYLVRGQLRNARELGEQILARSEAAQDLLLQSRAHAALGTTFTHIGELRAACTHFERVIEIVSLHGRESIGAHDPRVASLSYMACDLYQLGYPDRARATAREAVTLARGLSQPADLAFALTLGSVFHRYLREMPLAEERAEEVIALASEHGFPYWLAFGTMMRGWALFERGRMEEGIVQKRQGLAAYRTTGSEVGAPQHIAALAEMYGRAGQSEVGLDLLTEALELVRKNDNHYDEAECYRLKGQLTLQKFRIPGATPGQEPDSGFEIDAQQAEVVEGYFQQAIEIARRQEAKMPELRATTGLCRLWQQQGKPEQARQMLKQIYGWFTEGFDTADLRDAAALLEELQ